LRLQTHYLQKKKLYILAGRSSIMPSLEEETETADPKEEVVSFEEAISPLLEEATASTEEDLCVLPIQ
jgi:hypothetical protein